MCKLEKVFVTLSTLALVLAILGHGRHIPYPSTSEYAQAIASIFVEHHDVDEVAWSNDGCAALFFSGNKARYILREVDYVGNISISEVNASELEHYYFMDSNGKVELITDTISGQSFELRPEWCPPPSLLPPDTRA